MVLTAVMKPAFAFASAMIAFALFLIVDALLPLTELMLRLCLKYQIESWIAAASRSLSLSLPE